MPKKGTPGIDYSGVHPDTGKYTVVRGNYLGVSHRTQRSFKKGEINPKAPKTPMDRSRKGMKICGANRTGRSASGEGICCNPAGWGTAHKGYGACRHHGGLFESHEMAIKKQRVTDMMTTYGVPVDTDPHTALLHEVQRTAGHVAWLQTYINQFEDATQLKQVTDMGIQPAVWIDMYQKERAHLVNAAKAAIAAGVQERQVQVAEQQGQLFAAVIRQILDDQALALTNAQKAAAPQIVRRHMLELPVIDVETTKETLDAESAS